MSFLIRKALGVVRRVHTMMLPFLIKRAGSDDRLAVLIATPTHGNLGDHAIVKAESSLLKDIGLSIFEIESHQYRCLNSRLAKAIPRNDLIVIDGGGNVGTLWPDENSKMNDIVERFVSNPVVIFPQTAYFENSQYGDSCRAGVAMSYAKNRNLLFFSRDRNTYDMMRVISPVTRNIYVPDIVLYLDESRDGIERSGALLCLRADKERVIGNDGLDIISRAVASMGLGVRETDTVVSEPNRIDAVNRDAVLGSQWDIFRSAEVVITDRLHGMLFSAITGTPCVALDNVSRKVSQGYEWIRHIRNIRIAATVDEVPMLVDEVLAVGPCRYDRTPLDPYYDEMKAAIRSVVE